MNRLFLAGGLLAGLSCANPGLEILDSQLIPPVIESKESSKLEGLMSRDKYSLADDPIRLDALRNFFDDSLDENIFENNVRDNLVLIKASGQIAHGYLIDDSGLVLTVEHMARHVNREGIVNGSIIDYQGNVYPIRRTELISESLDYAVLVAETGKDPKTHPLKFVNTSKSLCGEIVGFFTYSLVSPYESVVHEGGTVICSEHALFNLQDDFPKKHKGPSLDDSTKRGFSFISLKINHGDSGTPSFINPLEENPIFFGLATGTYDIDDGTVNNMGIVTSSSDIIYSLKYYLDDLDSP
ncbi:hypothetical protein HOM13_01225 [Candidatus Woesearchaeota archaeon]|jgi:hypothetical protein|nr:hypothetical protein [Candidatus Woesearchaeota archaeon]MBT5215336.1 hypothetical protein [Candidatus Woesearchaeota archaeon]MBT6402767.1 hypothetical protein [Candidatus Woesearchaeota archaeon]